MIKSDKERLDKLEAWAKFHDVTDKQVIGLHYDVEFLKKKTDNATASFIKFQNAHLEFVEDMQKRVAVKKYKDVCNEPILPKLVGHFCSSFIGAAIGSLIARYV